MSIVSRILAIVIMGAVGLGLIAFPMGMSIQETVLQGNGSSSNLPIIAPFLAVALLTIVIALWAPTARIAWGRLCVVNGLAGFALPLQGVLFSMLFGSTMLAHTTSATDPVVKAGARLGAGLAGAAITGALAFVGIFIGLIFIVAGYFVLRDAPRYYH
jgi:hypothetical protein